MTNKKLDEVSSESLMNRVQELDVQDIQIQIASERVSLFADNSSHMTKFAVDSGFYVAQMETNRKFQLPKHVILGAKVGNFCMSEEAVNFGNVEHVEIHC